MRSIDFIALEMGCISDENKFAFFSIFSILHPLYLSFLRCVVRLTHRMYEKIWMYDDPLTRSHRRCAWRACRFHRGRNNCVRYEDPLMRSLVSARPRISYPWLWYGILYPLDSRRRWEKFYRGDTPSQSEKRYLAFHVRKARRRIYLISFLLWELLTR